MFKSLFGSSKSNSGSEKLIKLNLDSLEKNEQYRLSYYFPVSIIYLHDDKITGTIDINLNGARSLTYESIYISVVGQNRNKSDGSLTTFYKRTKQIAESGTLTKDATIKFELRPLDYEVPSFYGTHFDSRYLVQASIKTKQQEVNDDVPIYVLFAEAKPDSIVLLKAEVGIQNVLHVEFVIQNPSFAVDDCIIGKVNFLIVKIRIVKVYIQIKRLESFNNGIVTFKQDTIICQHEILDGIPVRGDSIPIRFYMGGVKAWPYPKNTSKFLNVSYSIRFLLVDENDKHYYKDLGDYVPCYKKE